MNLKLSSILSTMLLLCFFIPKAEAQSGSQTQYFLPQLFPRSPSSTGLEKYGTYQVNEFTGVPDISIPLYTVEAGGFQVPITLSYHASGIKITDVASWVGLGWSVSSGGQITRKTMGLPDDALFGYLTGTMSGSYRTSTVLGIDSMEYISNGTYDTKPDIYSYDFPGHGGKFFFDGSAGHNFVPRLMPFAPLKVTDTRSTYPIGITRFNILDEHGNSYTFGDNGVETTWSESGGHTNENWYNSSWKVESMISQNRRDTVSFTYQQDQIYYPAADNEVYTVIDNIENIGPGAYSNASYSQAPTTIGNMVATNEKLPLQINFKNGKVVFELDTAKRTDLPGTGSSAYRLKDIQVYKYNYGTKAMELQKKIVFYTSYFTPVTSSRLRLDSIQIQDKAGSVIQHYRFDYNTSIALPTYLSYNQDYWGYYNGCDLKGTPNTMLTPQQTISYNGGGGSINVTIGQANRKPDSNYMQAFVLTGIHYPTGGYSTFTYQTNQYYNLDTLKLAGGLRIHTISSYDGINPTPIVKTYVYDEITARANFLLDYGYFLTSQTHRMYTLGRQTLPYENGTELVRSYSSNPHCDLEAYDGATVVYPSVTEYVGTPGTNIGRTDYMFTDQEDALSDASAGGTLVYLSSFYVRGHLLSKKEFTHLPNGTYQPAKLTTNTYTAFPQTDYSGVGLVIKKMFYNDGSVGANPFPPGGATPDDSQSYMLFPYDIISDDNYLTSTNTYIYDTNDTTKFTTATVNYKYDSQIHQQVTRTYHTDSKGNTIVSRSKYPADYTPGNAVIDSMVNRNMQAEAIEKYDTLKNVVTAVNGITGAQLNQFKTGNIAGTIVPSKISTLSVGQPLTNFVPSAVTPGTGVFTSDARYVQMISFDQYDGQNNIIQYTPRNATPTSILWDYQSENPIAQVKNATNTNGSVTQVAYTSFEANGKGNWTYSGAPVFDVSAPTGTMDYSLSAGNITSPTLSSGTAYVVSYWSSSGSATVYTGSNLTSTPISTVNGWTYYECQVPLGTTSITISGTTTIDELRLYPTSAQMTTYAYDPSGVRSISDTKGLNNYFEYDFAQRLKNSKDYMGNIVANYNYHTYDQTIANQVQAGPFTRNNCPPNTAPGSLSYTVPAGKYYSSTLASANADALYDMNINGQAKANSNCGCTAEGPPITITLTNTTSDDYSVNFSGGPDNVTSAVLNRSTTTMQIHAGTYNVIVFPSGSTNNNHTISMTGQTTPPSSPRASFNGVIVSTSPALTISIN